MPEPTTSSYLILRWSSRFSYRRSKNRVAAFLAGRLCSQSRLQAPWVRGHRITTKELRPFRRRRLRRRLPLFSGRRPRFSPGCTKIFSMKSSFLRAALWIDLSMWKCSTPFSEIACLNVSGIESKPKSNKFKTFVTSKAPWTKPARKTYGSTNSRCGTCLFNINSYSIPRSLTNTTWKPHLS